MILTTAPLFCGERNIGTLERQPGEEVIRLQAVSDDADSWFALTCRPREGRPGGLDRKMSSLVSGDYLFFFWLDGKRYGPFEKYQDIGEPVFLASGEILVTVSTGPGKTWLYSNRSEAAGPYKDIRNLEVNGDGLWWSALLEGSKGSVIRTSRSGDFGPYPRVDEPALWPDGRVTYLAGANQAPDLYLDGQVVRKGIKPETVQLLANGSLIYAFRDPATRKFTAVIGSEEVMGLTSFEDSLLSADRNHWALVWEKKGFFYIRTENGEYGPFYDYGSLDYGKNGKVLYCTVEVERGAGALFSGGKILGRGGDVSLLAVSPDGMNILWSAQRGGAAEIYNNEVKLTTTGGEVAAAGFDSKGDYWVVIGEKGKTRVLTPGGTTQSDGEAHDAAVSAQGGVLWFFDGKDGAMAGYDGKVSGPYEDIHYPLISPDGSVRGWIAIIDEKYTVFLNGKQIGGPFYDLWDPEFTVGRIFLSAHPAAERYSIGKPLWHSRLFGPDGMVYTGEKNAYGGGYCRLEGNNVLTGQ
jgi:hypothetical protein